MGKYLFITVFVLSLVLAAWGDYYKMERRQSPDDVLSGAFRQLKPLVPASGILYYRLSDEHPMVEGLIRARFVLAPIVLLPLKDTGAGATILEISTARYPLQPIPRSSVVWTYTDTLVHCALVTLKS